MSLSNKVPISAIILTYNEEKNIKDCLESIKGLCDDIFIVDSYSIDNTLEIAKKYSNNITQNQFENYSQQRNWAFQNLPIKTEWILNLDADHRVTDQLRDELIDLFSNNIDDGIKGFLVSRRTIFLNKWIKHGGHYPAYHSILFRKNYGHCENKLYDQHFVVDGKTKKLDGDIIDIITDSLSNFILRHNSWAELEAKQIIDNNYSKQSDYHVQPSLSGNPIQRKRFYRQFYYKLPMFIRPTLYFIYRYFIRLGFLDGTQGLIFHFLQGFWFRFLVDAKIYEVSKERKRMETHGD